MVLVLERLRGELRKIRRRLRVVSECLACQEITSPQRQDAPYADRVGKRREPITILHSLLLQGSSKVKVQHLSYCVTKLSLPEYFK